MKITFSIKGSVLSDGHVECEIPSFSQFKDESGDLYIDVYFSDERMSFHNGEFEESYTERDIVRFRIFSEDETGSKEILCSLGLCSEARYILGELRADLLPLFPV